MTTLPRYFTPALSETEKERLYKTLHLAQIDYHYYEAVEGLIVYAEGRSDGNSHCVPFPQRISQIPSNEKTLVRLRTGLGARKAESLSGGSALWRALFPYPFRFFDRTSWHKAVQGPGKELLTLQLAPLWDAIEDLHNVCAQRELTLILFRREALFFPCVLHYVRGALLRAGTSPKLNSLIDVSAAALPETARAAFGVGVQLLEISLPEKVAALPEILSRTCMTDLLLSTSEL